MKRYAVVGGGLIAGMTAFMGIQVTDTVTAEPVVHQEYRAESLNEALQVCGQVSNQAEEVRACRDAAYAVRWVDHLPACAEEDSTEAGCVWVAEDRGNGRGDSFIVLDDGTVEYMGHDQARAYLAEFDGERN